MCSAPCVGHTATHSRQPVHSADLIVIMVATPEQADAKGKLWTPGQESDAPGEKPSPIWTPAGAGGST